MIQENKTIRLNRFIAMCGICSRRKAEILINEGKVSVNKKIVHNLGVQISLSDIVELNGKKISPQNKITTPVPEENKTEYGKLGRPTKYKWDGPEG